MGLPLLYLQSTEPSPELYERVALGGADAEAAAAPPEGYYPRSKSVSPVQRKIAQLEVGWRRSLAKPTAGSTITMLLAQPPHSVPSFSLASCMSADCLPG